MSATVHKGMWLGSANRIVSMRYHPTKRNPYWEAHDSTCERYTSRQHPDGLWEAVDGVPVDERQRRPWPEAPT